MPPAFSSSRQAVGFTLLLVLLLLLPLLVPKAFLPSREEVYWSAGWSRGAYPYIHDQVFEEKGDIDIAFMGYSRLWWGVDTPQVAELLSQKLGRKANVITLGWGWAGFDPFYFMLKDLLEHRKAHMIVFPDLSSSAHNMANPQAPYFFRLADNGRDIAGLGARPELSFYASAILGMPRNLLGSIRENLPAIPAEKISISPLLANIESPMLRLGSLSVPVRLDQPFVNYTPTTKADPGDVVVYSENTKQKFHFSEAPMPSMPAAFARKIGALAQKYDVRLVYLHIPLTDEIGSSVLNESAFWPDYLGCPVTMMGIPPVKLFAGMKDEDILKLFYNFEHLNLNGQRYFTSIIAPEIVKVYENQIKP